MLSQENNSNIQPIFCSIDPVVFSIEDDQLHILLHKRPKDPYKDCWALAGGLIQPNKDNSLEESVTRVLLEKTGAHVNYVEQLQSLGGWRDIRGWTLSVAYIALVAKQELNNNAQWIPVKDLGQYHLAFDHAKIVEIALERLTNKVNYSTLPMHFLGDKFTLPQLQRVYEVLLNEPLDKATFRKKIEDTGMIEDTGEKEQNVANKPAKFYRLAGTGVVNFTRNMIK